MSNKILVVNGDRYGLAIRGLGVLTGNVSEFMKKPKDFKLLLFTGGEDVDPRLYGDTSPQGMCSYSAERDIYERAIFNVARKNDILMAGICRGSQFLNVMSGGKMMHHINHHAGRAHIMETATGDELVVNSYHHQMSIPPETARIVGWASPRKSDVYFGKDDELEKYDRKEVEAVIFPNTKAFGVQYHPEMMDDRTNGYKYFWHMVYDALNMQFDAFVDVYTGAGAHHKALMAV